MLSFVLQETLSDVMDRAPIGVHLAFVGYSYTATRSHSYHILSQYQRPSNEWGIIQNYVKTVMFVPPIAQSLTDRQVPWTAVVTS